MIITQANTRRGAPARQGDARTSAIRARTTRMIIGVSAMLLIPAASALATPAGQNGDIAFRRYLGPDRTNGAIFSIAPDGSGERQLTRPRAPLSDDFPDFAPDGSFIAFHRGREGGTSRILTVRPDGTGLRRVDRGCRGSQLPPRCAEAAYPAIAPNGRRIAFVRYSGRIRDEQVDDEAIFSMRTDGSHVRRVTRPRSRVEVDADPQWSPDGRKIVFLRVNLTAKPRGKRAVFTVNADGSGLRRVTPWAIEAGDGPDWSPDGTRILFRSPQTEDFLNSNLYTIRPDGTSVEQITDVAPTTRVYSASFSPDGTSITLGMAGVEDAADVFTMRLDGTAVTPLTRTPLPDSAPDWGPSGATAALAKPPPTSVHCGQSLTQSVRLANDVINCPGDGLMIGADGITVDLDGHTIDGVDRPAGCDARPSTAGVGNPGGYDRVTVENGTVQQFDTGFAAGSMTDGMSHSRLHDLTVRDNRFGGIDLGSGAGVAATEGNRIEFNVVSGSACGAGIELNTGRANRFADNRVRESAVGIVMCCGAATDGNAVVRNAVSGTEENGIVVFFSGETRVAGNVLSDLGDSGIAIVGASSNSVVQHNRIARTQGVGIVVESCCGDNPAMPTGIRIAHNALTSIAEGIILFETDRNVVSRNAVSGAGRFGDPESVGIGIWLDGVNGTLVDRNAVLGGRGPGIQIGAEPDQNPSARPPTGNLVTRNASSSHASDGIRVLDVARDTTVERNTADRNGADGIHVLSPFTAITRNTASRNANYGIEAVAGVTDSGGNRARGNGNSTQCAGIACR